jgi:putative addiction module antidote
MAQKLYRNGNSVAMTIPKQYLNELNLAEGSTVVLEKRGDELVVAPEKKVLAKGVDHHFAKAVDEFFDDHRDVLRELADK